MKVIYHQIGRHCQATVMASAGNVIWTRSVAVQDEDLFQVAKHVRHVEFVGSPELGKGILACLESVRTITCISSDSEFLESLLPRAFLIAKENLQMVTLELCELPRTIEPSYSLDVNIKNCTGAMTCSTGRIEALKCYCPLLEPIDPTLVENVDWLHFYGDGGKDDIMDQPDCFISYPSYNVLGPEALQLLKIQPNAALKISFITLLSVDLMAILESSVDCLLIKNCELHEWSELPKDLVNSTIEDLTLDLRHHMYLYAFSELFLSRLKSLQTLKLFDHLGISDQSMHALSKLSVERLVFDSSVIEPGVTARFERVKQVELSFLNRGLQPEIGDVFPNAQVRDADAWLEADE